MVAPTGRLKLRLGVRGVVAGKVLKRGGLKFFNRTAVHGQVQRGERVRRLINRLTRNGKKYRPQRAVGEARMWLKEYFGDNISSFDRLENVIALLETGVVLRLVLSRGKKSNLTPYVVSSQRRVGLGVKFFVKGIRARIKNTHVALTEAIFEEALGVENGGVSYASTIKADHLATVRANMLSFRRRAKRRPY